MSHDDSDLTWRDALTSSQVKSLLLVALDIPASELLDRAQDAATPVADLESIKEEAKTRIRAAQHESERESARLLYHVAVASALVHHGTAISGRPLARQQPVYDQLAKHWQGHSLAALFLEAAARARDAEGERS